MRLPFSYPRYLMEACFIFLQVSTSMIAGVVIGGTAATSIICNSHYISGCEDFVTVQQHLPVNGRAVFPSGRTVNLEVAATPDSQELGLMNRPLLPPDLGMLFTYSSPKQLSFWMKHMDYPIDIVFLQDGLVKHVEHSAPVCPDGTFKCPTYEAFGNQVLELRPGSADSIHLGDRIKLFLDFSTINS